MSPHHRRKRLSAAKPRTSQPRLVRRSLRERKPTSAWYAAPPPSVDSPASTRAPIRGLVFRHHHNSAHSDRSSPSLDPPSPETDRRASVDPVRARLFYCGSDSDNLAVCANNPVLHVSPTDQGAHSSPNISPFDCSRTPTSRTRVSASPLQSQVQLQNKPLPVLEKRISHYDHDDPHPLSTHLHRISPAHSQLPGGGKLQHHRSDVASSPSTPNLATLPALHSDSRHGQFKDGSVLPLSLQNQTRDHVDEQGSNSCLLVGTHLRHPVSSYQILPDSPGHPTKPSQGNTGAVEYCEQQIPQCAESPLLSIKQRLTVSKAVLPLNEPECAGQKNRLSSRSASDPIHSTIHVGIPRLPSKGSSQSPTCLSADNSPKEFHRKSPLREDDAVMNDSNADFASGNHAENICQVKSQHNQLSTPIGIAPGALPTTFTSTPEPKPDNTDTLENENMGSFSPDDFGCNGEHNETCGFTAEERTGIHILQPHHRSFIPRKQIARGSSSPLRSPLQSIDPNEQRSPSICTPLFMPQAPRKKVEARSSTPCVKLRAILQGGLGIDTDIDKDASSLVPENHRPVNKKRPRFADTTNTPPENTEKKIGLDRADRGAINSPYQGKSLECLDRISLTQGRFWLTRSGEVRRMLRQDLHFHNMLSFVITLDIHHAMFVAEVVLSSRGSTGARCVSAGHTEIFIVGTPFAGVLECTIHTTQLRLRRGDHLAISSGQTYRLDNTSISDCPLLYIEAALP